MLHKLSLTSSMEKTLENNWSKFKCVEKCRNRRNKNGFLLKSENFGTLKEIKAMHVITLVQLAKPASNKIARYDNFCW